MIPKRRRCFCSFSSFNGSDVRDRDFFDTVNLSDSACLAGFVVDGL
jgi:hypothetical protein